MPTPHAGSTTKLVDPSAPPASLRFSTNDLPLHERVPFSKEVMGRHWLNLEIDVLGDAPFHCESDLHSLPGLSIASVTSSAARGTRTRELIARGNADEVVLAVSDRGPMHLTWLGREMIAVGGEAALVPTDEPASTGLAEEGSFLMYAVPVKLLQPFVGNIGDSLFRRVPSTNEALRLLVAYTRLILAPEANSTPDIRHAAAAHMRDLIALALGATRDGAAAAEGGGLRAARFQAIKADVTRDAASLDLNVAAVAQRHGLSLRSLQLMFEAEGTTFSQFVLEQRLLLAHRALSSRQNHPRSISDVALDCGFSNVSYFSRAFRHRFGASPSELRAEHMG